VRVDVERLSVEEPGWAAWIERILRLEQESSDRTVCHDVIYAWGEEQNPTAAAHVRNIVGRQKWREERKDEGDEFR
jgi:hypothetical protein